MSATPRLPFSGAQYHADSARPTTELLEAKGVSYQVLGGGRIEHDQAQHDVFIYGHSYGFPWQVCQAGSQGFGRIVAFTARAKSDRRPVVLCRRLAPNVIA